MKKISSYFHTHICRLCNYEAFSTGRAKNSNLFDLRREITESVDLISSNEEPKVAVDLWNLAGFSEVLSVVQCAYKVVNLKVSLECVDYTI